MAAGSTGLAGVSLGAAALVVFASVAPFPAPAPAAPATPAATRWLEGARGAGEWLLAVARPAATGTTWAADPATDATPSYDLYHGTAGVVPFLFALGAATGDLRFDHAARAGADAVLAEVASERVHTVEPGLYTGLAGLGTALLVAWERTGEVRYRDGVARVTTELLARSNSPGAGAALTPVTDVVAGQAGIGLFLLRVRSALDPPLAERATTLAAALGRGLAAAAEPAPGGVRWRIERGADSPSYPNFSHGTAGVSYFLTELVAATGDDALRAAALAGARHLLAIADTEGDACLVYHHEPGGTDLHYLSWCHGPAGTARLFHRLGETTGDPTWFTWRRRAAQALVRSGIPEQRTPGFWNNVGRCCGSAGVIEFLTALARHDPQPVYRDLAARLADDLLARATPAAMGGLRFVQAEHRVQPDLLQAQTGLMQGAAGIGLALLELWALETGAPEAVRVRLPDSPW